MADMLSKLKRADEDMLLENLSRRGFIKVTSCAALGLATLQASEALATMKASPLVIMEKAAGMIVGDPTLCVCCQRCELACTEFNDGKADKCFLCNGAPKCVDACPAAALRYVPWSDRTREATTRGSFSLMVPDDRRAACNACHVESPGGPRNLKYEQ